MQARARCRRSELLAELSRYARFDFDTKDVDWCVRLSPHYYNTAEEVDTVAAIMTSLADRG